LPRIAHISDPPGHFLGGTPFWFQEALASLERQDTVGRIWSRDHTLWKPDPTEIADRLGWLNVDQAMRTQSAGLEAFRNDVQREGFRRTVVLGMGGSSLGVEVLPQVLAPGPALAPVVLDSTLPERVQEASSGLDPATTLFLVSSKSGSTLETLSLYQHFRRVVERAVGQAQAGQHFAAITDAGSPLETLGRDAGFRRVFLNPPDFGGRYSVLSLFGLAPAALMGISSGADQPGGPTLLDGPQAMRRRCSPAAPVPENPGAWLGAALGGACRQGRNKLTLVCSPGIASFGLWVEQLLAESTGKEGTGIVPVVGEPLADSQHYGPDRLFVYCRLGLNPSPQQDARMA
jgi:glucose-6-phosphate isomerase/transaldolase/glucose-6-phosphate isomerase